MSLRVRNVLALLTVAALVALGIAAASEEPEPTTPEAPAQTAAAERLESFQRSARRACERSVRQQLKAPGTAKFSEVTLVGEKDVFFLVGKVDSENSFGALLRTGWTCEAKVVDDETVSGSATVLDD